MLPATGHRDGNPTAGPGIDGRRAPRQKKALSGGPPFIRHMGAPRVGAIRSIC
jgi:hypothetical protein